MPAYTIEDAELLIKGIRNGIELQILSPKFRPEMIEEQLQRYSSKARVLVKLFHHPTKAPRASYTIGGTLSKAIPSAASALALGGSGQAPISAKELGELLVELNILDERMELSGSPMHKMNLVTPGRDGLMVEYGTHKSMLLPSYAAQNGLGKTQLLEAACASAGLEKGYWKQPKVRIYKFEAQRFIETSPNGSVMMG